MRISHKTVNLPLTAIQLRALERLLPNAITDTGSNKVAASYRQILDKCAVRNLFVAPPKSDARAPVVVKPDPDGKNADRAKWAETALRAFQEETGTDDEDMLGDLLADLLHWCDREGQPFTAALRTARLHYKAETGTGEF